MKSRVMIARLLCLIGPGCSEAAPKSSSDTSGAVSTHNLSADSSHAETATTAIDVPLAGELAPSGYPLVALEDVFTLEPIVLQENAKVITADPLFFPDTGGGIFVADEDVQQFRKYRPDGTLEWYFGRYGEGPEEFITVSTIARISDRQVAAAQHQNKVVIWDVPTNRAVKTISYVPVRIIKGPLHYLGNDRILLQSFIYFPGDRGLHVLNWKTGTIERSFFTPRTAGYTWNGALPAASGRIHSSMRGDTIASIFVYSDTIYLHTTDGTLIQRIPFATEYFESERTSPADYSFYMDWMKSVSKSWRIFWLNDGSFLIEYYRPLPVEEWIPRTTQPSPRALMRMSRGGRLMFDILDPPTIATVDPAGNVYFHDELSLLPNHLIKARLK
jgi:hypothetical protein